MKKTIILGLVLLSLGTVVAQEKVMLVTDINTPDLFSASAAGSFEGLPVLVLNDGGLDSNITSTLNELNATQVILVGGPVVISENVESELESLGYNVTRLWGISRTGTAIRLAKYFWYNNTCAVLVEDTYESENDSLIQSEALTEAALNKCPLIPVPYGEVSAEVLELLEELNVTRIRYIAQNMVQEVRNELNDFNLTEITGNLTRIRETIQERASGIADSIVIVATPNWNGTLSVGANLNNNSIVRRVTNIDDLTPIISYIQENNISVVKVVGEPNLSRQVSEELENNGIETSVFAGSRPAHVVRRLWLNNELRFRARNTVREAVKNNLMTSIRNRVRVLLNETNSKINELKAMIESWKTEGYNTTALENALRKAENKLEQAEGNISSNAELSKRLMNQALSMVNARMWVNRELTNWSWREEFNNEVRTIAQVRNNLQISVVENNLTSYTNACGNNSDEIKELVNEAKTLRDQSSNETDSAKAASLISQARDLIEHAKSLGKICLINNSIGNKLRNAVTNTLQTTNATKVRVTVKALVRNAINSMSNNN